MNTELESKMYKFNRSKDNLSPEPNFSFVNTRGRKFAEAEKPLIDFSKNS